MLRFLFFSPLVFSLLICSCAENDIDVSSASATAVFDFEDNESSPEMRLAVFLQVTNDVQRTESFTVENSDSGYVWQVSNPGIFTGLNKNYTYSVSLVSPENASIPQGEYKAVYHDAAGEMDEINFTVEYDKALISSKVSNFKDFMTKAVENIALYDENGELLYMGKIKPSWKTNAVILRDYRKAYTKRICYIGSGNKVICLMPGENLREN